MNNLPNFEPMRKGCVYNNLESFLRDYWNIAAHVGLLPVSKMQFTKKGTLIAILYYDQFEDENY